LNVEASFVRSAVHAADLPRDGLAEIAFVGRSNVGKSSLINALVRQRVARTSAAPGKTRLANIYRVGRGGRPPFYLVDLPGYGYARGGPNDFAELVDAYFRTVRLKADTTDSGARSGGVRLQPDQRAALLLVDARHPGLDSDRAAWTWLGEVVAHRAIVATKIDKLSRGERIRALSAFESVFEHPVLPVSAATGEGLDDLWKLIDRLLSSSNNSSSPHPRNRNRRSRRLAETEAPAATATPDRPRPKNWTSRRSRT
jgi:GTP-binding protein